MKNKLTAIFGIGTLLAFGIAFAATYSAGYSKGKSISKEKIANYELEMKNKEERIKKLLETSTDRIITKYVDRVQLIKEKEYVYLSKIDELVPVQFNLSNGWVFAHDSFVQDRDAPAAGIADASPSEFTDVDGLKTVIGNYAICKQNSEQLKSLQDWIVVSRKEIAKGDKKNDN